MWMESSIGTTINRLMRMPMASGDAFSATACSVSVNRSPAKATWPSTSRMINREGPAGTASRVGTAGVYRRCGTPGMRRAPRGSRLLTLGRAPPTLRRGPMRQFDGSPFAARPGNGHRDGHRLVAHAQQRGGHRRRADGFLECHLVEFLHEGVDRPAQAALEVARLKDRAIGFQRDVLAL